MVNPSDAAVVRGEKANITRMIQPPTEDQLRSRPQI
jgi:hypothetical protein